MPDPALPISGRRPSEAVALTTSVLALAAAVFVANILVLAWGERPGEIWSLVVAGTWGNAYGIGQTLYKATSLSLAGLAVAYAYRAGLFNVGAEGQVVAASFVAALTGAALPASTPAPLAVLACLLAGVATGASLGALVGFLRVRFNAHEVITTIMGNFIVSGIVGFFLTRYFAMPESVQTRPIVHAAELPHLGDFLPMLAGSAANVSMVVVPVVAAVFAFVLDRTTTGLAMRAVATAPTVALASGVRASRVRLLALTVSGGIAGLAALNGVLGHGRSYEHGADAGVGFTGIAIAMLSRGNPYGVVAAALLFATLSQGGLVINARVPRDLFDVVQAVTILAVVAAQAALQKRKAP